MFPSDESERRSRSTNEINQRRRRIRAGRRSNCAKSGGGCVRRQLCDLEVKERCQDHMSADERMREFLSRSVLFRCAKEKKMQTPTYYLEALDPRSFRAVGGLLRSATSDILTSAQIKQDIDDDEALSTDLGARVAMGCVYMVEGTTETVRGQEEQEKMAWRVRGGA
ncbi:uncharacterized protein STEHIDRAFT_106866 [Stereum hirsutum FP-91666 SS1]|uniref:uncharacterized protein n=1 Tax=Stereum hirsutum (strain FP-91666) TaxID=721885 RepID=UPI000440DDC0|nr:uncharacterized protein STEHIDRAFT_106866 [Stereum hirsutum FP-91666 SS1]EIM92307.1 hypothetical protein STEHIDRAFT_106866 [Stereum hirsutum FP-91666 SS1]